MYTKGTYEFPDANMRFTRIRTVAISTSERWVFIRNRGFARAITDKKIVCKHIVADSPRLPTNMRILA